VLPPGESNGVRLVLLFRCEYRRDTVSLGNEDDTDDDDDDDDDQSEVAAAAAAAAVEGRSWRKQLWRSVHRRGGQTDADRQATADERRPRAIRRLLLRQPGIHRRRLTDVGQCPTSGPTHPPTHPPTHGIFARRPLPPG